MSCETKNEVIKDQNGPKLKYPAFIPTSSLASKVSRRSSREKWHAHAICLHIVEVENGVRGNCVRMWQKMRVLNIGATLRNEVLWCCGWCDYEGLSTSSFVTLCNPECPKDKAAWMSSRINKPHWSWKNLQAGRSARGITGYHMSGRGAVIDGLSSISFRECRHVTIHEFVSSLSPPFASVMAKPIEP
jgi:hypothetical protein